MRMWHLSWPLRVSRTRIGTAGSEAVPGGEESLGRDSGLLLKEPDWRFPPWGLWGGAWPPCSEACAYPRTDHRRPSQLTRPVKGSDRPSGLMLSREQGDG